MFICQDWRLFRVYLSSLEFIWQVWSLFGKFGIYTSLFGKFVV